MSVSLAACLAAASPSLNTLLEGPQRPAVVAGMIVAGLLYLIILVAGLLILVRAFRASVVWGLVVMFVPFGVIAFVATHWQETMKPFLVQLACGGVIGAFLAFAFLSGGLRPGAASAAAAPAAKPTPHEVRDLAENKTPPPAATRPAADPAAAQRAAYVKHAKDLTALYQQLNVERPKLKPGSPAMAAFNAKAAKYQQGLQALADEKTRLDALDHAANLNGDAANALAGLQASAASEDYEGFAVALKKALAEDRGTPSFAGIVALARTTLAQATPDKIAAGLKTRAARTARAEFDKTTRQVQGIVNQAPPVVPRPPDGAEVYHYGYHPGAETPDYDAADNLLSRREVWKGEFAYLDEVPGVYYRSAECEFNPQTKFFYLNRNVPKKKLSDAEYRELTRLYHQLGQQEKAAADAAPPPGVAERVSADLAALRTQLDGYAMK